ncbi:helix-turn-helix domain-containing protein [Carnobacterium mobile]|uniref:helix-turn-helix domain-containing protein n=1 Tax=Carnobacterium mobile TaxID=2750 RepID=UPI000689B2FB|nr:helix-turn-helix domain-containing protein [Carnobacterium mobile]
MDKHKEILRYQNARLSQRQTAEVLGVSRNTVSKVIHAAKAIGLDWEKARSLTEQELEEKLFPKSQQETFQVMPDYEQLTQELRKSGVTKNYFWENI